MESTSRENITFRNPFKTDIAVLLLFFTRSDTFRQVFEAVRQARPSKLLLYQDGPRGERDMAGIEACRKIVSDENIDWECEVHRNYLTKNQGCDPSGFLSHKWAFSIADKVIVLEDDVVPAQSFFPFCKEMLDRYENDERINMIAGFNIDEVSPDYKAAPIKDTVSFEDFEKLDIRVGLVKDCQKVKKSKKLLQFTIDDGSGTDRTICSGIAQFYENPEELIGKRILFVANFAPRQMMGIESQGMILSAVDADESLSVVTTTKDVKPGSQVG